MQNKYKTGIVYLFIIIGIGIYIGATARPSFRPNEHIAALLGGRHWNKDFQKAVNEIGMDALTYICSEPLALSELAKFENGFVQTLKELGETLFNKNKPASVHHPVGYKLSEETRRKQSDSRKKTYEFLSPEGERVKVVGLKELCEARGLAMSQMSRLAAGKVNQYRGWERAVQ